MKRISNYCFGFANLLNFKTEITVVISNGFIKMTTLSNWLVYCGCYLFINPSYLYYIIAIVTIIVMNFFKMECIFINCHCWYFSLATHCKRYTCPSIIQCYFYKHYYSDTYLHIISLNFRIILFLIGRIRYSPMNKYTLPCLKHGNVFFHIIFNKSAFNPKYLIFSEYLLY